MVKIYVDYDMNEAEDILMTALRQVRENSLAGMQFVNFLPVDNI